VLGALVGWLSLAPGDDAPDAGDGGGAGAPLVEITPPAPDIETPRRIAKDFAPWMEAVIQGKTDVANRLFPLQKAAQDAIESPDALRIFGKFPKLNGLKLALVGARGYGDQTGTLLFTITTKDGPIAIKLYHYQFGNSRYIGKVEVTDDWEEIDKMYQTVDILQTPVVVSL
jgi:hypothetical protein